MRKNRSSSRSSPKDDFERLKNAFDNLKSKYQKLLNEHKQLKKMRPKFTHDDTLVEEEFPIEYLVPPTTENEKPVDKKVCGKCKSAEVTEFEAGIFVFQLCGSCKHKRRVKTT